MDRNSSLLSLLRLVGGRLALLLFWLTELAIATYYSVLPGTQLGTMPGSDKLWHGCGYLLMGLPIPLISARRSWLLSAGLGLALYGITLEFVQQTIPGRSYELADMFANSAGVLGGLGMGYWLRAPAVTPRPWRPAAE